MCVLRACQGRRPLVQTQTRGRAFSVREHSTARFAAGHWVPRGFARNYGRAASNKKGYWSASVDLNHEPNDLYRSPASPFSYSPMTGGQAAPHAGYTIRLAVARRCVTGYSGALPLPATVLLWAICKPSDPSGRRGSLRPSVFRCAPAQAQSGARCACELPADARRPVAARGQRPN